MAEKYVRVVQNIYEGSGGIKPRIDSEPFLV